MALLFPVLHTRFQKVHTKIGPNGDSDQTMQFCICLFLAPIWRGQFIEELFFVNNK